MARRRLVGRGFTAGRLGWRGAAPALLAAALLAACAPEISNHGYHFDETALAQLEPGRTTRDGTLQLLGSPSSIALFDDNVWYYVSQRRERMSFYQEEVVAQKVVTVTFDERGVVQDIARQDLDDAFEVSLVDRETPTSGNELSILEQFLGNLGRFNPEREADAP
jgi:outer membrane protein assembly factor BamE (lipoprotein component of BamABCDE complex)